jgi:hypothetical protein
MSACAAACTSVHSRGSSSAHDAAALRVLEARVQGAELDRDLVAALRPGDAGGRAAALGDDLDGALVSRQVLGGSRRGARPFAQHVEAEAHHAQPLGLLHGVADGARIDELVAQQLDGPHGGCHHGARAQALQQPAFTGGIGQEALGQADGAGRQAGQHLVRPLGAAGVEIRAAQLIGRQGDGGFDIGHTQQGLGQPHQRQALGLGNRVLAQQRFHGPEGCRRSPCPVNPGP